MLNLQKISIESNMLHTGPKYISHIYHGKINISIDLI